jgi:RHS repeat-associated protein
VTRGSGATSRQYGLTYGADGLVSGVTDPLGRKISLSRDAAGRTTRAVRADGTEVTFDYDARGKLTALTPPGRPEHLFDHTAVDQLAEYISPDVGEGSHSTQYSYNADRDFASKSPPGGSATDVRYNGAGSPATVSIPRGTYTFAYDESTGQLTGITAPDGGQLAFSHDGILHTETDWSGTVSGSVAQSYNNDLRVASRNVNGGDLANFDYDDDGLLTTAGSLNISRDSENGLIADTTLDSVTDARTYNAFGELTTYEARYQDTTIFETHYTRDGLGRILALAETLGSETSVYTYSYDVLGRLTGVDKNGATISTYQYDDNGNRLAHNAVTGTYDNQDRLLQYGAATFSYTPTGELRSRTVGPVATQYVYDALGNLIRVILPSGNVIEYVVDGRNRRVGKKVDGTLVQAFLYKDQLNPIAELDGTGNIVARFVYASRRNSPDYMVKGGTTYRIISDHLGSPRLVVNAATGAIAQRLTFDEFGNVLADTDPGFQPFGFAGGLHDIDTGLVRFGARDYDSSTGRWTAKDPEGFAGNSTNLYGYVWNDPVQFVDPSGRQVASIPVPNPAVNDGLVVATESPPESAYMSLPEDSDSSDYVIFQLEGCHAFRLDRTLLDEESAEELYEAALFGASLACEPESWWTRLRRRVSSYLDPPVELSGRERLGGGWHVTRDGLETVAPMSCGR